MPDLAPLTWLLAIEGAGLCALPLAVRVFRRLDDRGYGLTKPLGLALVGYLCWALASLGLLDTVQPTVLFLTALVAGALWWWNGREALAVLRAQRRLVLVSEVVFLAGYVLAVVVRAYGPTINGQEKFMDMAIYHAFLRSERLPAEDPWLSGYAMPYYYFGYFLWALVAKATGVAPAVGYNLALASTLGLLGAGVFSLAYTLVLAQLRGTAPGGLHAGAAVLAVLGAVATAIMGNLQAAVEAAVRLGWGDVATWRAFGVKSLHSMGPAPGLFPEDGIWWFGAARVIPNVQPDGITEFPWFSLILGDLHPHFTALPFDLLVLGLALAAFRNLLAGGDHTRLDVAAAALGLGLLIPLNTWDVGTFWVVYAAALLAGAALAERARRLATPTAPTVRVTLGPVSAPLGIARAIGLAAVTFGLAVALYVPYFLGYQSQPLGIERVTERTMLGSIVILFGPFLVLTVATALRGWLDGLGDPTVRPLLGRYWWAAAGVALVLAVVARRDPTLAVVAALLLGTAPLVLAAWERPGSGLLAPAGLLLLVCALGLLLGTELLFIRDSFGTRMNTVFKFYYHVWLLLGLLSPLLLVYLVRGPAAGAAPARPARLAQGLGGAGAALALALGLAGLLYPVGATWTKANGFRGPPTLDGAAWLETSRPGDAAAVRWLLERMPGRPTIVEAFGDDYSEAARISTFSGLPTMLGWIGHELQWRGPQPEFEQRRSAIEAVYRGADPSALASLLQGLRVDYVYVGGLEAERYGPGVRDRFEGRLDVVYRAADVTIYRVPRPTGIGVGLAEVRP